MLPTREKSLKLFRFAGIQVYLHWSWFLVAYYMINHRRGLYPSLTWNALEYVGLFGIVLMHEFGHSLACRQVGGQADQIVLWPFGGVAYVNPPQRPGAVLWSIAAGPLVNVVLAPVLFGLLYAAAATGWNEKAPAVFQLLNALSMINLGLLIFNLMPVYPLDGGQILRALLWFPLGPACSLTVATIIGFFGVAGFFLLALYEKSIWLGLLAAFAGLQCWRGFQQARILSRLAKVPRRPGFACPSCHASPVEGSFWVCGQCRQPFDMFATLATCPHCAATYRATPCLDCGVARPIQEWVVAPPIRVS